MLFPIMSALWRSRPAVRRNPARPRLAVEVLEGRAVPASFTAATVPELVAAIDAANQNSEPDTITLAPGATFTLTAVNNTAHGPTGLPVIYSGESVTIVGNGDIIERSTAAGTPGFRLFDVVVGTSLTLKNLTLQGGLAYGLSESAKGGGIRSEGNLTLDHVTATANVAQGQPGMPNFYTGSGFLDGGAAMGGAVWARGYLMMTSCTVANNQAIGGRGFESSKNGKLHFESAGGAAFGGGVFFESGDISVIDSTISMNIARGGEGFRKTFFGGEAFGGGIYIGNVGTVTLHGVTITGNTAQGGDPKAKPGAAGQGVGGGLYIGASTVFLDAFTLAHLTGNDASTSNDDIYTYGSYTPIP